MKYILVLLITFFTHFVHGQEKGLTPVFKSGVSNGQTYAVVVGISDYQDEGIPDLSFADKDAMAFAAFLQSSTGGSLDEDHLKVLLNEEATVAQFAIALDWLWEVVKENDKVIIYFSGHGDVERKSLTQPGFLLCWDAPARVYMAGGAFALSMLQKVISTLSIQNKAKVIVITDACRSGKLSGSTVGGAQITGSNLAKQYANEIKILSCQPEEYSIEGKQWGGGRGAFSYHLVDGLMGLADNNEDGQVSLKEIGRYLEDRVTEEVAPLSQNPMVIGNKIEKISEVFPDLLAQVKARKKGANHYFNSTASRGIEEDVLAEVDSSIVETYIAFQKSLKEKNFLSPKNACSEAYYQILISEPKLEKLYSSMRRNYAAALQDDAQQVMNNWLKSDLNEYVLSKITKSAKYGAYPQYLDRAAELLGEGHYMSPVLKARKLYFEAYLMHMDLKNPDKVLGEKILSKYRASLQLLPNSPHTFLSMAKVHFHQMDSPDSSEYYTHLAVEFAPTWFEPYSSMGSMYLHGNFTLDTARAKHFLELADKIDFSALQSNVIHLNNWGSYYKYTNQYDKAEFFYQKAMAIDSSVFTTSANLAGLYFIQKLYTQSAKHSAKAIELDSTQNIPYSNLGISYIYSERYAEAEEFLLKAYSMDSLLVGTLNGLFTLYMKLRRFDEAEFYIKKSIELDPAVVGIYNNLAQLYLSTFRWKQAEEQLLKCIEIDSTFWRAYAGLGTLKFINRKLDEALSWTQIAIKYGPGEAQIYCQLGTIYANLPDSLPKAETAFYKALEMEPLNSEVYIYLVRLSLVKEQPDKAFEYLAQGLELGAGKESFSLFKLKTNPKLWKMRKDPRWKELMKKYFPDKAKE